MQSPPIDRSLIERLYRQARAERWDVPIDRWAEALGVSASRGCAAGSARDRERYLAALHLEDLALACACGDGHEAAWEHFVRELRPVLYRAADLIDPSGGARELADSLYADLYGLRERDGQRQSLFSYFHGRSSLATWLRAVLAQRHVDRVRKGSRIDALPDEESVGALAHAPEPAHPERLRYLTLIGRALSEAVSRLSSRDRLRLGCYYAQGLTLAEVGRLLHEHEATVSRHVARTRRAIREDVERQLRLEAGLSESAIAECFASVVADPGPIDLGQILGSEVDRKETVLSRSVRRRP
jgi:RNA polymerase sigma-70 factor (ECF subfamily)